MIDRQQIDDESDYGNPIIGVWYCRNCYFECFPLDLEEEDAKSPFRCPDCGTELYYDEEE